MPRKGLFDFGDGVFKGKGSSAINASRNGYNGLLALFGRENLPSSIMRATGLRPSDEEDKCGNERGISKAHPTWEDTPKHVRKILKGKVSGSGAAAGALSKFPQNIGRSVVLLYSEPGDTVFDPFAGHNSRMDLCVKAGRHYIGCDLSTEFMQFNFERAEKLREVHPSAKIKLHHCDSRSVPVKDEVGDFTLTSPPYYDIEYYGDEPEQLGKCQSYESFLKGLRKVMRENFRCLKPGAFACWFVNDFRRKGRLHFYHIDTIRLMESVGFTAHDIMIVDLGRGIRDCFPNQIVKTKVLPKRHEYCLVFRKPPITDTDDNTD